MREVLMPVVNTEYKQLDPNDNEIKRQVEMLTQRLEHMERLQ